jgi:hypothetical protein
LNLSDNHIKVLIALHNEENHCVKAEKILRIQRGVNDFDDILLDLLKEDLVEYEAAEDTYYLAYEGFEIVEAWQEAESPVEPDDEPQYIIAFRTPKEYKRLAIRIVLAIAIFGGLVLWLNPDFGLRTRYENIRNELESGEFDEVERELKNLVDSIQNIPILEDSDTLQ